MLVDHLLRVGFDAISVLDLSAAALAATRARLAPDAPVSLICDDVLSWSAPHQVDVWHDRAVFYFLTDPMDIDRYVAQAGATVSSGGTLVLGTCSEDGPATCSGFPTARYRTDGLAALFDRDFEMIAAERAEHHTPNGDVQPFSWVVLRRRAETMKARGSLLGIVAVADCS